MKTKYIGSPKKSGILKNILGAAEKKKRTIENILDDDGGGKE